ncbi:MAG: hypothetical protein ACKVPJ_09075 [Chitinophagales bacterium]
MSINILRNLRQLTNISKNYQRIAATQVVLIFAVLTMGDLFYSVHLPAPDKWIYTLLLVLEAVYLILLLNLAKNLNSSKKIQKIILAGIIAIFILSIIALNPLVEIVDDKIPWLIAIHTILCAIECYLIALGLQDIYSREIHIAERLWGSVAVYLMIALGWASFYEVIVLLNPASLGTVVAAGYQSYSESLYYSLCAISGTGSVYTDPTHLVRNLALIEAVWGVLFLVMLIGRLFSLPSPSNEK